MSWILSSTNGQAIEVVETTDDSTHAFTSLLNKVAWSLYASPTDSAGADLSTESKYLEFLKKGGKVNWAPNNKFYYLTNGDNIYTSDGYVVVSGDLRDFTKETHIVWPEKFAKMEHFDRDVVPVKRMKNSFTKPRKPRVLIDSEWTVEGPDWQRFTIYRESNLAKEHDAKVTAWISDWRAAYAAVGKTTPDVCPFVSLAPALPVHRTYFALQAYERLLKMNIQWMDANPPGISEDDPVVSKTTHVWKTNQKEIDDPTGLAWNGFDRETGKAYEHESESESDSDSEDD